MPFLWGNRSTICESNSQNIFYNLGPRSQSSPRQSLPRTLKTTMADAPEKTATPELLLDEVTGDRVSKTELKKRQKQRQKDADKATRLASRPAPVTKKTNAESEEKDLNPNVCSHSQKGRKHANIKPNSNISRLDQGTSTSSANLKILPHTLINSRSTPISVNLLLRTVASNLESYAKMYKSKLLDGFTIRERQELSWCSMTFAVRESRCKSWYVCCQLLSDIFLRIEKSLLSIRIESNTDHLSVPKSGSRRGRDRIRKATWAFEERWHNWCYRISRSHSTKEQDWEGWRRGVVDLRQGSHTSHALSTSTSRWIL